MGQSGFANSVEMKIKDGNLVLSNHAVREGWSESFQLMAANGDDELLIDDAISTEHDEDWQW